MNLKIMSVSSLFLTVLFLLISVGLMQAQDNRKYNRKDFPHWQRQTCTSRALTLFRAVQKEDYVGMPCNITSGVWILQYSNITETNPSKIDIDHVIPLKYAHEHGANTWNKDQRTRFANDQENLVVTSQRENRSKGAKGPSEYLPPENVCWYINQWLHLSSKYQLTLNDVDVKVLSSGKQNCSADGEL